jgi:hypothetical protein
MGPALLQSSCKVNPGPSRPSTDACTRRQFQSLCRDKIDTILDCGPTLWQSHAVCKANSPQGSLAPYVNKSLWLDPRVLVGATFTLQLRNFLKTLRKFGWSFWKSFISRLIQPELSNLMAKSVFIIIFQTSYAYSVSNWESNSVKSKIVST